MKAILCAILLMASFSVASERRTLAANMVVPVWDMTEYTATISEDSTPGTVIVTVSGSDEDSFRPHNVLHYYIRETVSPSSAHDVFEIDSQTGVVKIATGKSIDISTMGTSIVIPLGLRDTGLPKPFYADPQATLTITITDYNDKTPVFSETQYNWDLMRSIRTGVLYEKVRATDADHTGGNIDITYSIASGNDLGLFIIDSSAGNVRLINSLTTTTLNSFTLIIMASDNPSTGNGNILSSTTTLYVTVTTNEKSPIFLPSTLPISVAKTVTEGTEVGAVYAKDEDELSPDNQVTYSVIYTSPTVYSEYFKIASNTGKITHGGFTTSQLVSGNVITITVQATDGGNPALSATGTVVITIEGIITNVETPTFEESTYSFNVIHNSAVSTLVGSVLAVDNDGSAVDNTIEYSINSGNDGSFTITDHHIYVAKTPLIVGTVYTLIITATDTGSPPLQGLTTVIITIVGASDPADENKNSIDSYCICYDDDEKIYKDYICSQTAPCTNTGVEITQCLCSDGITIGTQGANNDCNGCPAVVGPPVSACLCSPNGDLGTVSGDSCICPTNSVTSGGCTCYDGTTGMLTASGCTGCPALTGEPISACLCANGEIGTPQPTGLCGCDNSGEPSDASKNVAVGDPVAVCLCSDGKTIGVPNASGTCTGCSTISVEDPVFYGGCTCSDGVTFGSLTSTGCSGCPTTDEGTASCICSDMSVGAVCTMELKDAGKCTSAVPAMCVGCGPSGEEDMNDCVCSDGTTLGVHNHDGSCTGCPKIIPTTTDGSCVVDPVLVEQKSQSTCTLSTSFGCLTADVMWVNNGCRGIFDFNGLNVECKSSGYGYNTCHVVLGGKKVVAETCRCPDGTYRGKSGITEDVLDGTADQCICKTSCDMQPVLLIEGSDTTCVLGQTFGCIDNDIIKVWGGCRGTFWFNGLVVECNSYGYDYTVCQASVPEVERYVEICLCPTGATGSTIGYSEDTDDGTVDGCSCYVDPCLNLNCAALDPNGCYASGSCETDGTTSQCSYTYKDQGTTCVGASGLLIPACDGNGLCIETPKCEYGTESYGMFCDFNDPPKTDVITTCPDGSMGISACTDLVGTAASYTLQSCTYYCITLIPVPECSERSSLYFYTRKSDSMDICGQDYQTGGIWADSVDGKKDVGYCECEAMCNAVADCKGFNSGNYNDNYYQCYLFNDEFSDTPDVPSWLGDWDPRCYVRQDSPQQATVDPTTEPTTEPTIEPTIITTIEPTQDCIDEDTAGQTDKWDDGCEFYDRKPWSCGSFDDSDFTASELCCACVPTPLPTPQPTADPTSECTCWDGSTTSCGACPVVPCTDITTSNRALEENGITCCSATQLACPSTSCVTTDGYNICGVTCKDHASCASAYGSSSTYYCATISTTETTGFGICYPVDYCLYDVNPIDGTCPNNPCLTATCATTDPCQDTPTCVVNQDGTHSCNPNYKSSGSYCPHGSDSVGTKSMCDGSGACVPNYNCGGNHYATSCSLCLNGGSGKCRGECAMVGGVCSVNTLGCNWLKIGDSSWVMNRIEIATGTTFDACVTAVQTSDVCDTSLVQFDDDGDCKCVNINDKAGHIAPGDSDLYYCYPNEDCIWKADYNNYWCVNRIKLDYGVMDKTLANCAQLINENDECSKFWMQTDFTKSDCKCLPANEACKFTSGDSTLNYCYNSQEIDCTGDSIIVSSDVYANKFNFNVDFRLFMTVTVDEMQTAYGNIFEGQSGTSNIRLEIGVSPTDTTGKYNFVFNVCDEEARRRLCIDCIVPPPCSLSTTVTDIDVNVAYDITVVYTGGYVKVIVGKSSENLITELGSSFTGVMLGEVQMTKSSTVGFGYDTEVFVCSNADDNKFYGKIKSLDYRTDWTP